MVKETSIYNNLKKIVDANTDLKVKLNAITEYIYQEYNLSAYFCKILVARWSFFAGERDIYLSVKRFKISDEIGLIIEDNNTTDEVYSTIIESVKSLLN